MADNEKSPPLHDATIIGSDLDRYLRDEFDDFDPVEDAPLSNDTLDLIVEPMMPELPRADPESAYQAAAKSPNLAAKAFAYGQAGVLLSDRRNVLVAMCNAAFLELTGYQYAEVVGTPPAQWVAERSATTLTEMNSRLKNADFWRGEVWIKRYDGRTIPTDFSVRVVRDSNHAVMSHVITVTDISDFKHAESLLLQQTLSDPLTGLVNRTVLTDRLEQALAASRRTNTLLAILFLNLDRFKLINDSLGHAAGDSLLCEAARRLKGCVRDVDTVARIGADEFVLLLGDVTDEQAAAQIALKIGYELHRPYLISGQEVTVTSSIGICLHPNHGSDSSVLLQHADTAMHRAKDLGRNRYVFYQSEMTSDSNEQFAMEKGLVLAIQRSEFVLYYQPQIDIQSGRIAGVEALIRWQHPELGLVAPDRFIPIAEETGLIRTIGEWVIRQAGADMQAWREAGLPPLRLAINLSALQIARPQHTDALRSVLIAAGMAYADSGFEYEIEITESTLMTGENTMAAANALKGLGLTLAIDDFGTGYSSMMALRELPLDRIKIDKSFVRNLPNDKKDIAMTAAMIAMGTALDLRILAEGVENLDQLACLRELGCHEVQGFLFSRPVPIETLRQVAAERDMVLIDPPPPVKTGQ